MTPIDLTPAEAMILLDPDLRQGRNPFKVSLMWLLAQRHLKATEVRRGWLKGKTTRLSEGPRAGETLPDDLQAVMDVVRHSGTGLMDDVVKAASNRFGRNLLGFQNDHIYPALIARQLITRTSWPHLLVFTRERWAHTPAGKALAVRIEALFEDARRIPGYLDRSPAQAAALAATLGGLILLLPELRPYLEDIAMATRQQNSFYSTGGDSGSSAHAPPSQRTSGEDAPQSPASEPLDFNFDFGAPELDNLDGLDASLASLDASFEASADAGSGGGDGGGGGGGGD